MKILSIDTTGLTASVAVIEHEKFEEIFKTRVLGEFTTNYQKTHSTTIMPIIDKLLCILEISMKDIDFFACASGPGSFTGLRIGAATAKGLAHATNKKIAAIPTLDALAFNVFHENKLIIPIMDARRNQVYTAYYLYENNKLVKKSDYLSVDINEVIKYVNNSKHGAIFLGDGVPVYENTIVENCVNYQFAMLQNNFQRAVSTGMLAINEIENENLLTYDEFEPFYVRKSQAEREYDELNK